jgi:hypothetical protein
VLVEELELELLELDDDELVELVVEPVPESQDCSAIKTNSERMAKGERQNFMKPP